MPLWLSVTLLIVGYLAVGFVAAAILAYESGEAGEDLVGAVLFWPLLLVIGAVAIPWTYLWTGVDALAARGKARRERIVAQAAEQERLLREAGLWREDDA